MNSPLNWAGGKRWQVPMLQQYLGYTAQELKSGERQLVEPFCGGLSIALGLEPRRALLNDSNPHLINFWKWVQVGEHIETEILAPGSYHLVRSAFNLLARSGQFRTQQMAEFFYALNHWGYNGLWRVNASGEYNVPPRPKLKLLPDINVRLLADLMQDWFFSDYDFETAILCANSNDVVYADPPYDDGFTSYSAGKFSWDDQQRLAVLLSVHPGPVVLMNKATERIQKLYHSLGFKLELIESKQRMHHSRGRSEPVLEVMATS